MSTGTKSSSLTRPIIGVIVGNKVKITTGVRELVNANRQAKTTLYIFSTRDVDYMRSVVKGTYFNPIKNSWDKQEFPLPDVVYVRGGSGEKIRRLLEIFDHLKIKRINPIAAFNKSELFRKLNQDSNVRQYLPYTRDLYSMSDLRHILEKRSPVYVKACRGRRGTQVMRVIKLADGGYEFSYSIITNLVQKKVDDFESLVRALQSFFGGKPLIVQQAIDLVTVKDTRPVDFRAELQRNKHGEIEIVAIPIRIGQSKSPITTHASAYRFEAYLPKLFPKYSKKKIQNLKNKVYDFLKKIYQSVEKVYGKFGEIGIDFAVDKNGEIWLIECNAQSAKVSIRKCYGKDKVRKIYLNPLEYAKSLV